MGTLTKIFLFPLFIIIELPMITLLLYVYKTFVLPISPYICNGGESGDWLLNETIHVHSFLCIVVLLESLRFNNNINPGGSPSNCHFYRIFYTQKQ